MDGVPGEQVEGVRKGRQDGTQTFDRALLASGEVHDQGGPASPDHAARQCGERCGVPSRRAHLLGQAWRLSLDYGLGRFGGHVPRPEPGPAGRYDQRDPLVAQVAEGILGHARVIAGLNSGAEESSDGLSKESAVTAELRCRTRVGRGCVPSASSAAPLNLRALKTNPKSKI